jgi:Zn-dependent peptidase ImmA (M78 family)
MALGGESRNPIDLHAAVLLRALVPYRKLSYEEALFYAEQQASVFLKLTHLHEPPVRIEQLVSELGLAAGIRDDSQQEQPGMSRFDEAAKDWVIALSPRVSAANRSFVIAHEVKHILDNGFGKVLYGPVDVMSTAQRKEHVADYFAACLLMPRLWLERYWKRGVRSTSELAGKFGTSTSCMQQRLEALGLLEVENGGAE